MMGRKVVVAMGILVAAPLTGALWEKGASDADGHSETKLGQRSRPSSSGLSPRFDHAGGRENTSRNMTLSAEKRLPSPFLA